MQNQYVRTATRFVQLSALIASGFVLSANTLKASTNNITAGETKSGTITESDVDVYRYASVGNESVTIATSAGLSVFFFPVFDLVGPEPEETVLAAGEAFLQGFPLTDPGVYRIISYDASHFSGGTYGLTLIRNPGPNQSDTNETGTIMAGETLRGETALADLDVHEYVSPGNEWVTIATSAGISVYYTPVFDLVGPDGTMLTNGPNFLQSFLLSEPGVYQIVSRDALNLFEGPYELTLVSNPGPNLTDTNEIDTLAPLQTVLGTCRLADLDVYKFNAVAGDTLYISVSNAGGSLEPIVDVHSPDGDVLASGTQVRGLPLDRTARFQLVCHDSNFIGSGSYSLKFVQVPGPPPLSAPPEYLQLLSRPNSVVLRWSTNAVGFRLQHTDDLLSPSSASAWINHQPPYTAFEGFHFFTNAVLPGKRFFRLIKP